jgi:four helix bundle protein
MSNGTERRKLVESHRDLEVYQMAMDSAMQIFEASKCFPREEVYSLTDQIRRASRSVCANLAEAWRKRRYEAAFIAKLSDAESEAAEVQTWLEFAIRCGYLERTKGAELYRAYDNILGKIVTMIRRPRPWLMAGASPPKPVDKETISTH